ncbi:MAG: hypothetical protein IJY87_04390 [Bacilli bacterium]|nr:hypothetical protein [Bacilli bacterium]
MKKKILFAIFSIVAGITFTFFFLNKEDTFAKEEYLIYAFQVGAFEKYDNAVNFSNSLPSSIIKKEGNLYKIYVAMYKDIDIVNKMIVYFENNDINIYLKNLNVSKNFYNDLLNYETLIKNSEDIHVYNKVNQSILNLYLESLENE